VAITKTIVVQNYKETQSFIQNYYNSEQCTITFKRKRNKDNGELQGVESCKNFKNILMGSIECKKCKYHKWTYINKVCCRLVGKLTKVFNL
jgi:hypothetical protein